MADTGCCWSYLCDLRSSWSAVVGEHVCLHLWQLLLLNHFNIFASVSYCYRDSQKKQRLYWNDMNPWRFVRSQISAKSPLTMLGTYGLCTYAFSCAWQPSLTFSNSLYLLQLPRTFSNFLEPPRTSSNLLGTDPSGPGEPRETVWNGTSKWILVNFWYF